METELSLVAIFTHALVSSNRGIELTTTTKEATERGTGLADEDATGQTGKTGSRTITCEGVNPVSAISAILTRINRRTIINIDLTVRSTVPHRTETLVTIELVNTSPTIMTRRHGALVHVYIASLTLETFRTVTSQFISIASFIISQRGGDTCSTITAIKVITRISAILAVPPSVIWRTRAGVIGIVWSVATGTTIKTRSWVTMSDRDCAIRP